LLSESEILTQEMRRRYEEKLKLLQDKVFHRLEYSKMKDSSKEKIIENIKIQMDEYLKSVYRETNFELEKILK
jgi:hypothetical protein